jgi:hypothetical protein
LRTYEKLFNPGKTLQPDKPSQKSAVSNMRPIANFCFECFASLPMSAVIMRRAMRLKANLPRFCPQLRYGDIDPPDILVAEEVIPQFAHGTGRCSS